MAILHMGAQDLLGKRKKKEKNQKKNRLGDLKDILVTLCDNNI